MLDVAQQRRLAADLFNHVWTLIEQPGRSARETELMIHAAHASRFFWEEAGEPVNHARGEWQISRAYAVAGAGTAAVRHGGRCLDLCEEHGLGAFDLAYAHEALARGHALAGDAAAAAEHERGARAAAQDIADAGERALVLDDLATL